MAPTQPCHHAPHHRQPEPGAGRATARVAAREGLQHRLFLAGRDAGDQEFKRTFRGTGAAMGWPAPIGRGPVMSPLEFMQRLVASVPRPRLHLNRLVSA
jgi:hypothetical protein